jgi:hypothetical protein
VLVGLKHDSERSLKTGADGLRPTKGILALRARQALMRWSDLGTILQDLKTGADGLPQSGLRFDASRAVRRVFE